MPLVYSGILSHAPGITGRSHMVEPEKEATRDAFYACLERQREEIRSSGAEALVVVAAEHFANFFMDNICLLYTSDAADEGLGVDLGGRRIIKKKDII